MPESTIPIPTNEFERLLKLYDFNVDYSEIQGKLDDLTKLAAFVGGTSISRINLLDANTLWTISNYGLDSMQMPRQESICQYSVIEDDSLEIKDLSADERFKDKPFVTHKPNLRYYFGIPIKTKDNYNIGTLCLMDTKEQDITEERKHLLRSIANEVLTRLDYEKQLKVMRNNMDELKEIQRKVSHDIRGPIGGIIGLAEILYDQAEEDKLNEFKEMLEMINKGGRTILELADEILSNYAAQSDPSLLPENKITLPHLKDKLIDLYMPQARNKKIDFQVKIESDDDSISFNKQKIIQIIGNLATNAIKFTPDNGQVEINLNYHQKVKNLSATIKDTGIGFKPEVIEQFNNHRLNVVQSNTGTRNERGYGYGLQLAYHLTESMKGSIKIDSAENKGSLITLSIPLAV